MGYFINDDCINCGACAVECPTNAIFNPINQFKLKGKTYNTISAVHFYISELICDECEKIFTPKCIAVCPMNSIKIIT